MDIISQLALKSQTVCGALHLISFLISWPIIIGLLEKYLDKDRLTFNCDPKPSEVVKQQCYEDYTSTVSPLLVPLNFAYITFAILGFFWLMFILYSSRAWKQIKKEQNSERKKSLEKRFTWIFLVHVFIQLVVLIVMVVLFSHFQPIGFPKVYTCSRRNSTKIPKNQMKNITCHDMYRRQKSKLNIGIISIMAISIFLCVIAITHLWYTRKNFLEELLGDPEDTPARNESSTRDSAGDDTWLLHAEDTLENNQGSIERGEDFEMLPAEDSSAMKFLEWCQNQLRALYKTMCQVKITPWDPDNTVHIDDIYIQLTLLQDHRKPDGTTKKRVGDISEVFEGDEHHPIRRRILVYGRPGIGKSTFAQKLAVDWANSKKEILRKFALLLSIKLRDVGDVPDLCTMLKTAKLLSADDPMAVNNLYKYVCQNQEKVLFILDGYDEYSGGKSSLVHQIWEGSQLRDCCVMITTRRVKEDELRVPSHAQFELNGLDTREQKEQFSRKFLPNEEDVKGLLNYVYQRNLQHIAEIPLLLLMLCLLWKDKKRQLPTSRAYIYVGFIQTLLDHMASKESDKDTRGKSIDDYQEELFKIGKLAFDALLEDRLYFDVSKFAHSDLFEKLIAVGFFQVSKLSGLNREKIVYFLHKSVQEFFAGWFIVQELTVKKSKTVTCLSEMDTFEKSSNMAEVLKFVCGLSSEAAGIVFHHLQYLGEKECLTSYNFTKTPSINDLSSEQHDFILLCVDCLFWCSASDRTAMYSAFLSCVNHVVILGDESTSTAAVEHFFKSINSFPNYFFFYILWEIEHVHNDVLSIMLDLNAVVLTSSGESKDVKKYADLLDTNSFLIKSRGRNLVYLTELKGEVFHSEVLPELIAPVCFSQPPVDNLVNNETNNIALPLTENHCLSLVGVIDIFVSTVKDAVLLKNVLPLVTAPRKITIWGEEEEEEEEPFEDQLIESGINGINFTDNLHSLEVLGFHITAKSVAFISESLRHSPNLSELDFSFFALRSGVSHLAENLHHVPQLAKLGLYRVQIGERECAALAASLKYLNKLEELEIGDNALGHGIIELAESLNNVPNLTRLNLTNTNMGEDEASALALALKYVPELKYLVLSSNPLGRGVRDLVQHLRSVPKWVHLSLEDVQLTRREVGELCTPINKRNITVRTDYQVWDNSSQNWRIRTKAELKANGVKFRDEPDDDDDDDAGDAGDADGGGCSCSCVQ